MVSPCFVYRFVRRKALVLIRPGRENCIGDVGRVMICTYFYLGARVRLAQNIRDLPNPTSERGVKVTAVTCKASREPRMRVACSDVSSPKNLKTLDVCGLSSPTGEPAKAGVADLHEVPLL